MPETIFNHTEIYFLLYNGNTSEALRTFEEKLNETDIPPHLRKSYLSSLNFGIYNYVLMKENVSLHECCAENEQKIQNATGDTLLEIAKEIIHSYGADARYMIEKYTNKHIRSAMYYIHKHLSEPLSLDIVSREISINPTYLSDLFKKEVNENFSHYVTKERIKLAKKLLTNTTLSIQQISEKCGYENVAYFSTRFKQHTGKTPSGYRAA